MCEKSGNGTLHCVAHPNHVFHTKCNADNAKTTNVLCFSLNLKGLLGELEIVVLTNENSADDASELREFRSVGAPILAGVSPTKQMPKALVERTMPMDASSWAHNLTSDPFCPAHASKSNIVDDKC